MANMSNKLSTERPETYKRFGPEMINAMARVLVEKINILNLNAGLPTINMQELEKTLRDTFDQLTTETTNIKIE